MTEKTRGLAVTLRLGVAERDALARLVEVQSERAAEAGFGGARITGAAVLRNLIRDAAREVGCWEAPPQQSKPRNTDPELGGLADRFTAGRKAKTKAPSKNLRARMQALVAAGVVTQADLGREIGFTGRSPGASLARWSLSAEKLEALEKVVDRHDSRSQ